MLDVGGQTVGKYQVLEHVGRGGMSAIYKALDTSNDTTVAIKVLSAAMASDPTLEARFAREIEVLRTLDHPHILPILDYGEVAGLAFIVMPFYRHGTLQDRIDKAISIKKGSRIIAQISEALEYAHAQGITHRDVKPSNILFDEKNNAVLSDFGFAHLSDSSMSLTGSALVGTPAYMSPEQCRGEDITGRSDQYSLAVVVYQMVTGKQPFEADTPMGLVFKHLNDPVPNPRGINPKVPEEVEDVLLKALRKNPGRRYPSIAAFNQAFQAAVSPQKSSLSPVALLGHRLSSRMARAFRRIAQFLQALARSPKFMRRLRVGLALSILFLIPLAVWAIGTIGMGPSGASAAPVGQYSTQDPTQFAATVIAGFREQNGNSMSDDELSTAVAATVSVMLTAEAGGVTPTEVESTPTASASTTPRPPRPTPTQTPYVPPTATPTPMISMHVQDLDGSCKLVGSDWRATVTIRIVRDDGVNVSGATASGEWSIYGPGVSISCTTASNGICEVNSGKISAVSTRFTVTSVTHSNYIYDASGNVETQIMVTCSNP